ncbi:hypothetical protein QE152_g8226 [Popillia japonica]|uniref:Uncharacterized protein n=1 Tax=Popillia japonica TaxID=7064 RepID=A0AAW1MCA1_POPJA
MGPLPHMPQVWIDPGQSKITSDVGRQEDALDFRFYPCETLIPTTTNRLLNGINLTILGSENYYLTRPYREEDDIDKDVWDDGYRIAPKRPRGILLALICPCQQ